MGVFLVEPIVACHAFAGSLVYPLVQQYVYRRLWLELTNTSYPVSDHTSRCAANISNHSSFNEEVQKAASMFSLYTELFSMVPSLAVTLILLAYSDQRGRKITIIMPLIGSLIYTLSFLAVSFFELNLYLLMASSLVSSLFGGSLLGGCFSYIADLCEDGKQRTLRMAGIDMMIGLLSGVASLSTGYFLRAAGFNWPFLTSALFHCVSLLYAVFLLEETVKRPPDDAAAPDGAPPRRTAVQQLAYGVYHLFAGASRRQNLLLVVLLLTFTTFSSANVGFSMITLYELNEPLCWNEILIGYGSALSTTVFLSSFVGVWAFSRCGVPNLAIVLMGILSVMATLVMVAFAKTTLLMFLVRLPMQLAIMPYPVLRSMMSKIVPKTEQGALFACVAFVDSLSGNAAYAMFSSLYAATVAWYPGFSFLLAAGLCFIPIALLAVVGALGPDQTSEAKDTEDLIPEEERLVEEESDRPALA